jgi:Protein of unknown function (DUF1656)
MIHEVNVYGLFVTPMLLWTIIALAITAMLRRLMASAGLYRFVWHRSLFDLALLVTVLGGVTAVALSGAIP